MRKRRVVGSCNRSLSNSRSPKGFFFIFKKWKKNLKMAESAKRSKVMVLIRIVMHIWGFQKGWGKKILRVGGSLRLGEQGPLTWALTRSSILSSLILSCFHSFSHYLLFYFISFLPFFPPPLKLPYLLRPLVSF